ncbi:MAG: hypothetical protein RL105_20, partial [Verrucomicrobiota bacterium]
DEAEAVRWYRKAAEQGHAKAQYNLGVAYDEGRGVPKDYAEAYAWLNIASAAGLEDAKKGLSAVTELMTPEQKARAQARSTELHRKLTEGK